MMKSLLKKYIFIHKKSKLVANNMNNFTKN